MNKIKYINDTEAMVTKVFAKKAVIFGTEEYKLWRAYKADFPEANMVTKSIKKNPNKRTNKNLTYENMAAYIRTCDNAADLMDEFKKVVTASKVQTNPYRCVLAWFEQKFEGYDSYKEYFKNLAEKAAEENSLFAVA